MANVRKVDPLNINVKIVDAAGRPTPYFQRLWQALFLNADQIVTVEDAIAALEGAEVVAGDELTGGGPIASDPVIDHAVSGVTAGTYSSANITVNAFGHVTAASDGGGGSGLFNPPLAADFSTIVDNAGSTGSAADDVDRGLLLTLTSTAGTISYTQFLKTYALPGSGTDTFTWAGKYTPTVATSSNVCAGFVIADAASTTSDRLFFGFNAGWSSPTDYFIRQATGNTTVAGGPTLSNDMNEQECWFKIEIDSDGDIRFYVSRCGGIWFQVGSTTVATHLGSVSHIGWFLGGVTGNTGNMSVYFYEET
jgi:hypothetical protein